jgi:NADH-quinone oxidoreductase subunit L
VAVGGIAMAWLTYSRRVISADFLAEIFAPIRRAALARFWLDDLFEAVYGLAVLGLSRLVGWVDRYLVDGIVNVLSAWTLTGGDRLRRMQTGLPQDYVYGLAVGLLLLLIWVQWPR